MAGEDSEPDAGDQPHQAEGRNDLLRQARLRKRSPNNPNRPMSQRELAEALNAHIFRTTNRAAAVDRHVICRWEGGKRRPMAHYRSALRAVLGAATDDELGFVFRPRPPRTPAAGQAPPAPAVGAADEQAVRSVGSDGSAVQLAVKPGPAVILASATPELLTAVVPLLAALKTFQTDDEPALTTVGTG